MAALTLSDISFTVCLREPELVAPAKDTPCEMKVLSDIDDHRSHRCQIPLIQFYRSNPSMTGKDPVEIIRKALAETLVFYYPFAGRLREGPNDKFMVDCNGEGVVFIEADADVTLEEFGDLHPPFPCIEELIYNVPGTSHMLGTPLLIIQVTRLKCSGFIFGIRFNHTMCDGIGIVQFMSALGEIARGERQPSTLPVWQRELLNARDPPRVTCAHLEYDEVFDIKKAIIPPNLVYRSFIFGPNEIALIRKQIPEHVRQSSSTFEILTAFVWRYRTMALQFNDDDKVSLSFVVNGRSKFNPSLPEGYYGNAIASPMTVTTAGELCRNPLGYALELVKKMKGMVTEEYMHSLADLTPIKGRTPIKVGGLIEGLFYMSDVTRLGFVDVDFGWGKAVYGGLTNALVVGSFCIRYKNAQGQEAVVVPLCLRGEAMERFIKELDGMFTSSL